MKIKVFAILLCCIPFVAIASDFHQHRSKYSGQEVRKIKSFSESDLKELRRGGGWGLAKAAELNGVPGPIHLLEMKEKISLTNDQVNSITASFKKMQKTAIAYGKKYIVLHEQMEKKFRERTIDKQLLRFYLTKISQVRKELTYAHLSAHLDMIAILTPDQIKLYNKLRGL